jgi:hypothetical protein
VVVVTAWLGRRRAKAANAAARAEFLVAHPDHGLLVIEVKGGGI